MKTIKFAEALRRTGALLHQSCGFDASDELLAIADSLGLFPNKNVTDVLKLLRQRQSSLLVGIELGQQAQVQLELLKELFVAIGAAKFTADCDALLDLSSARATSVIPFGRAVQELLADIELAKTKPRRRAEVTAPSPHDPMAIRQLADRLACSVLDRNSFELVLAELSNSERFSLADLKRVADQFLGSTRPYRTRKDVLTALETRRRQEDLQAQREQALAKIAI